MDPSSWLAQVLTAVQNQEISVQTALEQLKDWPYEDLAFAKVDHHRSLSQGFPEVIFGLGKTPEQVALIFARLSQKDQPVLATRCSATFFLAVQAVVPGVIYHPEAQAITWLPTPELPKPTGTVAIVTAGTADLSVAEEAAVTAALMGCRVLRVYDVGVSGLHRLVAARRELAQAQVVIVVAGMEGALASVIGGMVAIPVVAVPTSVGYGANFGGLAALLGMLNSCALGVGVVNIDNGFGAAALAATIIRGYNRCGQEEQHAK
ncbi:MAG: nickel pincer cofactor biosynthesis protein LarB [Heliobacteriaceae bacterium]|nr:nickel pincer cofactor biosynthesis protein LarB [Heliobacteriaceae bacterium]